MLSKYCFCIFSVAHLEFSKNSSITVYSVLGPEGLDSGKGMMTGGCCLAKNSCKSEAAFYFRDRISASSSSTLEVKMSTLACKGLT